MDDRDLADGQKFFTKLSPGLSPAVPTRARTYQISRSHDPVGARVSPV